MLNQRFRNYPDNSREDTFSQVNRSGESPLLVFFALEDPQLPLAARCAVNVENHAPGSSFETKGQKR